MIIRKYQINKTHKLHVIIWRLGGVSPGQEDKLGVAVHVVKILDAALSEIYCDETRARGQS